MNFVFNRSVRTNSGEQYIVYIDDKEYYATVDLHYDQTVYGSNFLNFNSIIS